MSLPSFMTKDVLSKWNATYYDGSEGADATVWLAEIDRECDRNGIPIKQRIETTLHFMSDDAKLMMNATITRKEESVWGWEDFMAELISLDEDPEFGASLKGGKALYDSSSPLFSFVRKGVLSEWTATYYNGPSDVDATAWLVEIDRECDRYGIPMKQRIETALYYMSGQAKFMMNAITNCKREKKEVWSWEEFKEELISLDKELKFDATIQAKKASLPKGSSDVKKWLTEIAESCVIHNIPKTQWVEVAIHCLPGEAGERMRDMYDVKILADKVRQWEAFKEKFISLDKDLKSSAPPNTTFHEHRDRLPLRHDKVLVTESLSPVTDAVPEECGSTVSDALRKAPFYDGRCDVRQWLDEIETSFEKYGIPQNQRTKLVLGLMFDEARLVIQAIYDERLKTEKMWSWEEFKAVLVSIDRKYKSGDLKTRSRYPSAVIGITLIGVGSVAVLSALTAGILVVIGFAPAGVAAGGLATVIHSTAYGGSTFGLFSVLQSAGATAVAPSLVAHAGLGAATAAGFGAATAAVGGWLGFGRHRASPNLKLARAAK